jgi:hypothetical protein
MRSGCLGFARLRGVVEFVHREGAHLSLVSSARRLAAQDNAPQSSREGSRADRGLATAVRGRRSKGSLCHREACDRRASAHRLARARHRHRCVALVRRWHPPPGARQRRENRAPTRARCDVSARRVRRTRRVVFRRPRILQAEADHEIASRPAGVERFARFPLPARGRRRY